MRSDARKRLHPAEPASHWDPTVRELIDNAEERGFLRGMQWMADTLNRIHAADDRQAAEAHE
jgi:hypothetical protein